MSCVQDFAENKNIHGRAHDETLNVATCKLVEHCNRTNLRSSEFYKSLNTSSKLVTQFERGRHRRLTSFYDFIMIFSLQKHTYVFVKSYMTVTILLYNEFPSRILIRRKGNDTMVLIITIFFSSLFQSFCHGPVKIFTGRRPLYLAISLFHPFHF